MESAQPLGRDRSAQIPTSTTDIQQAREYRWNQIFFRWGEIFQFAFQNAFIIWPFRLAAWLVFSLRIGWKFRLFMLIVEWRAHGRLVPGIGPILDDLDRWKTHDDPHAPPILSTGTITEATVFATCILSLVFTGAFFSALNALAMPLVPYLLLYLGPAVLFPSWTADFAEWVVAEDLITKQWGLIAYGLAVWGHVWYLAFFNALCLILHTIWPRIGETGKLSIRMLTGLVLGVMLLPICPIWLFRQNLKVPYWYIKRRIRARNQAILQRPTIWDGEAQYVYSNLEPGYIRLLDISRTQLSGETFGGELQCHLRTVELAEVGNFDAISYTWGNPNPKQCIRIDDKMMLIAPNAYSLLQDRASLTETRTIWIDCICINQANAQEKSHQVTLMDQIYHHAMRTIIWLGSLEEFPDAELMLSLVGDLVQRPWPNAEALPAEIQPLIQSRGARFAYFEGFDPRFPVLARLLDHRYFFRVWIAQEVVFSTKIHIRCGGCWIDWEIFSKALHLMGNPSTTKLVGGETLRGYVNEPCALGQISQLSIYRDLERLSALSIIPRPKLCHLMGDIWMTESTDPRDMVFGLLNLCQEAKDPDFAPDYSGTADPKQFFTDMAQKFHSRHELHEILYYAGIGYPSATEDLPSRVSGKKPIENLPSWVPDWTCPPLLAPLRRTKTGLYKASNCTKPNFRSVSPFSVAVLGTQVDQIASITPAVFPGVNLLNVKREERFWDVCFQEIAAKRLVADLDDIYVNGQRKMEAFWRTLICDTNLVAQSEETKSLLAVMNMNAVDLVPQYEFPAPDDCLESFYKWDEVLIAIEESGLDLISCKKPLPPRWTPRAEREALAGLGRSLIELIDQKATESMDHLAHINCGRKFAVTKMGYMALVPPGAVRGDDVYVFDGLDVPFVTRLQKGVSGVAQLVGECYVHGIMKGEMYRPGYHKVEVTLV